MGQTTNNDIDPRTLADAKDMWHSFKGMIQYGSIFVAILLILMLVFVY